ncbi:MAG: PhzF family phenazine biosynthesis protein [Minisyncoccia bacterium]|jgi:PhzF family phenazine biosynthesis protein
MCRSLGVSTQAFRQVDVFSRGAFTGNPVAIVHDADDVSTEEMRAITRWTNLSEAAFLLQPLQRSADYRLRIFEPKIELPFAGHPTLGACAAWLDAGGVPQQPGIVVQECGAGLIKICITDAGLAFAAPPMIRHEPVETDTLTRAMRLLGLTANDVVTSHWIDNGPGWMGLQLTDAQRVLDIPMPTEAAEHFDVGVVGLYPTGSNAAIEVRAFFNDPNGSIREDPVTGSLNASIAQWMLGNGTLTAPYVAHQTSGRATVEQFDGQIWIGGTADVRVTGTIAL